MNVESLYLGFFSNKISKTKSYDEETEKRRAGKQENQKRIGGKIVVVYPGRSNNHISSISSMKDELQAASDTRITTAMSRALNVPVEVCQNLMKLRRNSDFCCQVPKAASGKSGYWKA